MCASIDYRGKRSAAASGHDNVQIRRKLKGATNAEKKSSRKTWKRKSRFPGLRTVGARAASPIRVRFTHNNRSAAHERVALALLLETYLANAAAPGPLLVYAIRSQVTNR